VQQSFIHRAYIRELCAEGRFHDAVMYLRTVVAPAGPPAEVLSSLSAELLSPPDTWRQLHDVGMRRSARLAAWDAIVKKLPAHLRPRKLKDIVRAPLSLK
jgi:hypothetical protein